MGVTIVKKPAKPQAKAVVATVDIKHADGSETDMTEKQGFVEAYAPLAQVTVSMGMTKKIADFENIKFLVSITVPCHNMQEDHEEAFAYGKKWVEQRIDMIHEEISAQLQ